MLQSIRDRAQGWIAWVIVGLISVPFALWGVHEYLGVGGEPITATVNGQEITERTFETRYREYRERMRQMMGGEFSPSPEEEQMLRREALEGMIRNTLILMQAEQLGMRIGDQMIRTAIAELPPFQLNGSFNIDLYQRLLRSQGLSEQGFWQRMSEALLSEQLERAISGSNWATEQELAEVVRLQRQTRSFDYLTFPVDAYRDEIEVSDSEIEAYYQANRDQFTAPEQVKLLYLELDHQTIATNLEPDEELLLGYYEQHQGDYLTPERRRASHILLAVEEAQQEAAVEAQARELLARLQAGEAFAQLARDHSQDPGSAAQGGDLGFFGRGVMVGEFEEVAYALEEGEISDLVRSPFGFHIIQLTAIQPESGQSFEQARSEVESAFLRAEAQRRYFEYAEQLADLAYEEPGSLLPAAETLGLELRESEWIPRGQASGLFRHPRVMAAAFSDDVLVRGNNSELIELEGEHALVLRIADYREASYRPLEEVRSTIRSELQRQQAAELARTAGEAYLERLRNGVITLAEVAEAEGGEVVSQQQALRNSGAPFVISNAAFALAPPPSGAVRIGEAVNERGDYSVILLSEVTDGDPSALSEMERKMIRDSIADSMGRNEFQHLVDNLRSQAKVDIRLREPRR